MSSSVMFFHGQTKQGRAESSMSLTGEGRPRCGGEGRPRLAASPGRGGAAAPGSRARAATPEGSCIEPEGSRIVLEGRPPWLAAPSRLRCRCWPHYPWGRPLYRTAARGRSRAPRWGNAATREGLDAQGSAAGQSRLAQSRAEKDEGEKLHGGVGGQQE